MILLLAGLVTTGQKGRRIALVNGIMHTGKGEVIERSLLVMNGTMIEYAGSAATKPSGPQYDTVIDISGKHLYPALINANNILGLHDAEAVRATRDYAEVGHINPHVRALIAYNTDNLVIPTIKTNGVLYTQVTPRGGLISGASSIMGLEGWNWEDAVLKADDGIHVSYPRMVTRKFGEDEESVTRNAVKNYNEELLFLDKFFSDARAYCEGPAPAETNLRFEAMRGVLGGKARLYLRADKARDILSAIGFAVRHRITYPVIVGGKEAHRVTAELRKHRIPVILNRVNDLPDREDDDVDLVYRLPYLLQRDSVMFCIQMEGDMEAMHSRNLPFNAGAAVAYGLSKEQALSAITISVARITGTDSLIGSLEAGKLASVVVSDGDILDIRTNNIIFAFLAGKPVSLVNQQTMLYRKYREKYRLK
jgi:imidazolonepropionase-like amidohydrolase